MQEAASNTFTDLLPSFLDEDLSKRVLKQHDETKLKSMFSDPEFAFFDSSGNFIGNNLKVIEELTNFCFSYKQGSEIEEKFTAPPFGWTYGTINVPLSVLLRAGNLKVKTDGIEIFDYKEDNERILKVFENSTKFKKSLFQIISENLEPIQKQQIVENLNKIKAKDIIRASFNTHTNDIALITVLKDVMYKQYEKYQGIQELIKDFEELKNRVTPEIIVLQDFNLTIDDSNFKDIAQKYLSDVDKYNNAVELVQDLVNFCDQKLEKVKQMMEFVLKVKQQFEKAGIIATEMDNLSEKWNENLKSDPSENYPVLNETHQKIRDEYYSAFNDLHVQVTEHYKEIKKLAYEIIKESEERSKTLNFEIINQAQIILQEADKNICADLSIVKQIECDNCRRTLYEVLMQKQLASGKKKEIKDLRFKIHDEVFVDPPPDYPKEIVTIPTGELSLESYKTFLMKEVERLEKIRNKYTMFIFMKEN